MLNIEENKSVQLEWSAPNRVYREWNRKKFVSIGTIIFFSGLFLIFFKQFWLLAVCLTFLFVAYALGTTAPQEVRHKITDNSVTVGGRSYSWKELRSFYFKNYLGTEVLYIDTNLNFPGRVSLLLNGVEKGKVTEALSAHLDYRENPPTSVFDKLTSFLSKQLSV